MFRCVLQVDFKTRFKTYFSRDELKDTGFVNVDNCKSFPSPGLTIVIKEAANGGDLKLPGIGDLKLGAILAGVGEPR